MFLKNFTFIVLLFLYPLFSLANVSYEQNLAIKAKSAFKKEKEEELKEIKDKTNSAVLSRWIDYWNLIIEVKKNPYKFNTLDKLNKFIKENHPHPLSNKVFDDWLNNLFVKGTNDEVINTIEKLSTHKLFFNNKSLKCLLGIKNNIDYKQAKKLIDENIEHIGCYKLTLFIINEKKVDKYFIISTARLLAFKKKLDFALNVIRSGKKTFKINNSEIELLKIISLSNKNSKRALKKFNSIKKSFSPEQTEYCSVIVGSSLFGITHPKAWSIVQNGFNSLNNHHSDVIEKVARMSLRKNDLKKLDFIISQMPPESFSKNVWRYWKAIILLSKGEKIASYEIFHSLISDWSFYGILSKETLGLIKLKNNINTFDDFNGDLNKRIDMKSLNEIVNLYKAKLYFEGLLEWNYLLSNLSDYNLLQISNLMNKKKIYDRSISASIKTKNVHNFSLRYPVPYKKIILSESSQQKISPWLIMGLIRQESRFLKTASSSAGALGLMQLMPRTAKGISKELKIKTPKKRELLSPDINIKIGTYYFKKLINRFNSTLLGVTAYNAGPTRAKKWLKDAKKNISGEAFAESIPFDETREYVKTVLAGSIIYSRLYDQKPPIGLKLQEDSFITLKSVLEEIN